MATVRMKENIQLNDQMLRTEKLVFACSLSAAATALGQLASSDVPSVSLLRSAGNIAAVDAIEVLPWTAPSNSANLVSFAVSPATASQGAVYSNNSQTFTVNQSISLGSSLVSLGSGAATASGTLTKVSGTGDATITFSATTLVPASVFGLYLAIGKTVTPQLGPVPTMEDYADRVYNVTVSNSSSASAPYAQVINSGPGAVYGGNAWLTPLGNIAIELIAPANISTTPLSLVVNVDYREMIK